jgi:hypothetical protein
MKSAYLRECLFTLVERIAMKNLAAAFVFLLLIIEGFAQDAKPIFRVTGTVLFSDGASAPRASVEAVTACPEDSVNFVQETVASDSGEFQFAFLNPDCRRVRISASKGLWLKTGFDVFYGKQIGTSPVVELSPGNPQHTEVRLGELGGRVNFRVRDTATGRFIWAGLSLERIAIPGEKFGSMTIATGKDGSADTVLLPAGGYEVSVNRFACNDREMFAASLVRKTINVVAGETIDADIIVDVRKIKPSKTSANPHGAYCTP